MIYIIGNDGTPVRVDGVGNVSKNWTTVSGSAGTTLNIPISFDELNEVSFRVLGNDSASFGYVNVHKDQWHNEGTYPIICNAFNELGAFKGSVTFTVSNKTNNSFDIVSVNHGAGGGFMVSYK